MGSQSESWGVNGSQGESRGVRGSQFESLGARGVKGIPWEATGDKQS